MLAGYPIEETTPKSEIKARVKRDQPVATGGGDAAKAV
jgi:hypothetical protein